MAKIMKLLVTESEPEVKLSALLSPPPCAASLKDNAMRIRLKLRIKEVSPTPRM